VLKNCLLPIVENKSHVIKGTSDCNDMRRTYDHITCLETEEPMELVLCCYSITLGSANHLETIEGSKMSYVVGECSVAILLKY